MALFLLITKIFKKLGTEILKFVKGLTPEIMNEISQLRVERQYPLRSRA